MTNATKLRQGELQTFQCELYKPFGGPLKSLTLPILPIITHPTLELHCWKQHKLNKVITYITTYRASCEHLCEVSSYLDSDKLV